MTTPNAGEYISIVGLDEFYYAPITQDDSLGYVADTPAEFGPPINVSVEPNTSSEMQYAGNVPFDNMNSEGESRVLIDTTNIPIQTLATILGKTYDAATGRMFDEGGEATPPDCAFGFRGLKNNGSHRYYWFLKGRFSVPRDEAATKGERVEPKPPQILFTAINTVHKFSYNGTSKTYKRVMGDEDSTNFSSTGWWSQVQTPTTTSVSALALSVADPLDDAANVAINKTITLTFNNALIATAIYNVTVSTAAGVVKACTCSLDATKKILTVNPDTDLANSTTYVVGIGVVDIYGQHLNTSINFATAAP